MADVKSEKVWGDFFAFRKMISLTLVKIVYAVGVIVITSLGIVTMIGSASFCMPMFYGIVKVFGGLGIILFGNLVWRLVCEWWVLLFSMHDLMVKIADNTQEQKITLGNVNLNIPGKEVKEE